jgi:uncharacterized protein DUF4382
MRYRAIVTMFAAVALLFPLCACRSGSADARVENGHGTLTINLTDAPLDLSGVQSVNVSVTGVTVYPQEGDLASDVEDPAESSTPPIVLLTHPETFDLLTLTGGAVDLLASGEVPAGAYSRIRLDVSEATLVYADGSTAPLKIDSQKVDVPVHFNVAAGGQTAVTLDFDAGASVQVNETANGTLILRPVVTPVSVSPPA